MNGHLEVAGFMVGDEVSIQGNTPIPGNLVELIGKVGYIESFHEDAASCRTKALVMYNTSKSMVEIGFLTPVRTGEPDHMDVNSKRGPISRNDVVRLIRDRAGCGIEEAKLIFKELVKAQEPARKVIQLTTVQADQIEQNAYTITTALCNDGTMWQCMDFATGNVDKWQEINPIPQPE